MQVDGSDFMRCFETMEQAVNYARNERKPVLVHAKVPLLGHHTSGVRKEFYRSREDLLKHGLYDPIPKLRLLLTGVGFTDAEINQIEADALELVSRSTSGTYLAVGDNGVAVTSPDLATWTTRTSGTSSALNEIAWSPSLSLFAVVGNSGAIRTTPDGVTWTSRTSGTSIDLNGIAWSPTLSLFVAVGTSGAIGTSPNGSTWTGRTSGTTQNFSSVLWVGSQFVAVGAAGTIVTSPDGITWTSRTSGSSIFLNFVASVGSRIVAGNESTLLSSFDGVTWSSQRLTSATYALVGCAASDRIAVISGNAFFVSI